MKCTTAKQRINNPLNWWQCAIAHTHTHLYLHNCVPENRAPPERETRRGLIKRERLYFQQWLQHTTMLQRVFFGQTQQAIPTKKRCRRGRQTPKTKTATNDKMFIKDTVISISSEISDEHLSLLSWRVCFVLIWDTNVFGLKSICWSASVKSN